MKKIIHDTCILAALMVLVVFVLSILWAGITQEILLVLELFGLAFLLSVCRYLVDEKMTLSQVAYYLTLYGSHTSIVLAYGFVMGWFDRHNFWMAFLYTALVFGLSFGVDQFLVKRDIALINQKIQERK